MENKKIIELKDEELNEVNGGVVAITDATYIDEAIKYARPKVAGLYSEKISNIGGVATPIGKEVKSNKGLRGIFITGIGYLGTLVGLFGFTRKD